MIQVRLILARRHPRFSTTDPHEVTAAVWLFLTVPSATTPHVIFAVKKLPVLPLRPLADTGETPAASPGCPARLAGQLRCSLRTRRANAAVPARPQRPRRGQPLAREGPAGRTPPHKRLRQPPPHSTEAGPTQHRHPGPPAGDRSPATRPPPSPGPTPAHLPPPPPRRQRRRGQARRAGTEPPRGSWAAPLACRRAGPACAAAPVAARRSRLCSCPSPGNRFAPSDTTSCATSLTSRANFHVVTPGSSHLCPRTRWRCPRFAPCRAPAAVHAAHGPGTACGALPGSHLLGPAPPQGRRTPDGTGSTSEQQTASPCGGLCHDLTPQPSDAPAPPCRPPHCRASPRCAEEAERGGNLRLSLMRLPERATSGEGRAAAGPAPPAGSGHAPQRTAAPPRPAQRACLRRGGGRKSRTVSPLRAAAVPARAAAGGAGCSACRTAVPCPAGLRGTPGRDRLVNGLGAAAFNQTGLRKGVFQPRSARGAQPESVLNRGVGFPASCCRCV